jgi:hypothetical protein
MSNHTCLLFKCALRQKIKNHALIGIFLMRVRRVVSIGENDVSQSTAGRLQPAVFRANIDKFFRKSTTKPRRGANQGMLARPHKRRASELERDGPRRLASLTCRANIATSNYFYLERCGFFKNSHRLEFSATDLKIGSTPFSNDARNIASP